jgi:hypothetical protein
MRINKRADIVDAVDRSHESIGDDCRRAVGRKASTEIVVISMFHF